MDNEQNICWVEVQVRVDGQLRMNTRIPYVMVGQVAPFLEQDIQQLQEVVSEIVANQWRLKHRTIEAEKP